MGKPLDLSAQREFYITDDWLTASTICCSSSSCSLSILGFAAVLEFAALPDTECDNILSTLKSMRRSRFTVTYNEVECMVNSLHVFSRFEVGSVSGSHPAVL